MKINPKYDPLRLSWGRIPDPLTDYELGLPENRDKLQDVVSSADFWLHIHSAILYGLMTGDAESIDVDKCLRYVGLGKKHGVFPEKGYICPEFKRLHLKYLHQV